MTDTPPQAPIAPTFREWLGTLSDEQLAATLRLRPDTVLPVPPGIGPLAARLQLRASVSRAVRTLDALHLAVVEAAADLGAELQPVAESAVIAEVRTRAEDQPSPELIATAVADLRARALFYGRDIQLVREAMGSLPQDWQLLPDPGGTALSGTTARELLATVPEDQRKILDTLARSGGRGLTKDAAPDADPTRPVPQLIATGLLTRTDAQTVSLPLNVRRLLRGEPEPAVPLTPSARFAPSTPDPRAATRADQSGTAAGLEVTRHLRQLIELLGAEPLVLLKEGDVGVRATAKLARQLQLSEDEIIRLISVGEAAGLLGRGEPVPLPADDEGGDYLAPTPAADPWLAADLGQRWSVVLRGWWSSPWQTWLVGMGDEHHGPRRLLSTGVRRDTLVEARHLVLRQVSRPAAGTPVPLPELLADLRFSAPVAALRISEDTVARLLAEARWVGAVAGDTATTVLHTLLGGADLAAATEQITPGTVEQVIPQADMTILAPGPLPRTLQQEIELLAELESAGLASVYRVTDASVRRALDTGRTGADLKDFLAQHSLGEVPQSITYLIDDVARRHGSLRGGPALSYLRCDDESLLLEAVRTNAAREVGLRLIAPTVAIAQTPLATVIDALRDAGFQPVAEDAGGASLDIRPTPARVTVREEPHRGAAELDESRIRAAVAAIRRAEGAETRARHGIRTTEDPLSVLQAAARAGRTVTLGFVDKQGRAVHRVVRPLKVGGGQVDAVDPATGSAHRFTLHRITEVIVD